MQKGYRSKIGFAFVATLCLSCNDKPRTVETTSAATQPPAVTTTPPEPKKISCPIKLIRPRMAHNLEEDVYATVLNVSDSDITAIAFGAAHTDKFGRTWTPYKTDLTSEDTIKEGTFSVDALGSVDGGAFWQRARKTGHLGFVRQQGGFRRRARCRHNRNRWLLVHVLIRSWSSMMVLLGR